MKGGKKLATKRLNASKFTLGVSGDAAEDVREVATPIDRSLLRSLADLVDDATSAFESFDYARSLERTETFFWSFCDDYVELVKTRAYGDAADATVRSAAVTLRIALSTVLRLFAPVLPYVTEEVWSWWRDGSIHRAQWPDSAELRVGAGEPLVYAVAAAVLAEVRKAKSQAKVSVAAPVARVVVVDTPERLAALDAARQDVCDAGKIAKLEVEVGAVFTVGVELAEPEA